MTRNSHEELCQTLGTCWCGNTEKEETGCWQQEWCGLPPVLEEGREGWGW